MPHEIRITRRLPATPAEVYDAWTDAQSIAEWMCPGPGMSSKATLDVRVGGRFHIDMMGPGVSYPHDGEYLRLDRPRLIEFTWISDGTQQQPTVVTIELKPAGDDTELTLTHSSFPQQDAAERHEQGWGSIVDSLAETLMKIRR